MLEGLQLLSDWSVLFYILMGVVVVSTVGVIPGLGGVFALVLLLPFAFRLDFVDAIALLMGATVVSGTANTITSVLVGVPGSSTAVATVIDGYPMARRGEGARAIAAGLTASAVGGIFGGLVLGLLIPVMRPLVLALGSAEFLVIVVAALLLMASVGNTDTIKTLLATALGVMLSFVGLEGATGTQRFTFGSLYLWDGLKVVPAMIGLFAIAEMSRLIKKGTSIASEATERTSDVAQLRTGIGDAFRHKKLLLQSSLIGVVAGLAPGIGGTAGQFMAYSQAARSSPKFDDEGRQFGEGRVEGVIGADASTNSVEGGSLVPTLALGIPGSVPMAILIAVFMSLGIRPGASMLTENLDIVWMIIWLLIGANVVAAVLALAATPILARVAYLPPEYIVPPVLAFSLMGAYATSNHIGDVLVAVLFGFIGLALMAAGFSRVPFVIGFVLGPLIERFLLLTRQLYGWNALTRPGVLVILGAILCILTFGPALRFVQRRIRADA